MARATGPDTRKPLIGVTGNNRRFSVSWYCIALGIAMAGGRATRIHADRLVPVETLDGLVISGGDDIHPEIFGEEPPPSAYYDRPRDELEQEYIRAGEQHNLPILGICRGHQLINAVHGGSLFTNIRSMRAQTSNRRSLLATKTCLVDPTSRLCQIVGTEQLRVNSLHYQSLKEVATGFTGVARDLDDICQAMESGDGRVLGVQWHPEYLLYHQRQRQIFAWLVKKAQGPS